MDAKRSDNVASVAQSHPIGLADVLVGRYLSHFRVRFHFTPTYSSWLNQVEIWFGKIERDVIAHGVFTSVTDLSRKLMKYIRAYARSARPIRWTDSAVGQSPENYVF